MISHTLKTSEILSLWSEKTLSIFSLTLLLVSSFYITGISAEAQELVCPMRGIQVITNEPSGNSEDPSINADGSKVVFNSTANINGGNPDETNEVYLFDSSTQTITQITNFVNQSSRDAAINADGTRIAFVSNANINGGNPNDILQIFVFDTTTGIFTQVTDDPGFDSDDAAINADGSRVAFRSESNINGGNPNNVDQIYIFDTNTGIFTQITDDPMFPSFQPSISADGTRVAFESDGNINGNNTTNNREMYLFDSTTGIITQITDFDNFDTSENGSISADGTLVAFLSRQNINGTNPGGRTQIFIFDSTTGATTQITNDQTENSRDPSISGNGLRVGFETQSNINNENPGSNNNVFVFDTVTSVFTKLAVVPPPDDSEDPSVNFDGTRIAFESDGDINGPNIGDNDQIYLAICFDPENFRNIPTLSEWGLIAMAGVLGIVGFIAIQRRKAAV